MEMSHTASYKGQRRLRPLAAANRFGLSNPILVNSPKFGQRSPFHQPCLWIDNTVEYARERVDETILVRSEAMNSEISISRDKLMQLLEVAEEALYLQYSEFSNTPTDEERELLLSLYRLAGKEVPPYFAKTFGWTT